LSTWYQIGVGSKKCVYALQWEEKKKRGVFVGGEEQRICVNSREEMFRKALKSHNSQEDGYCWDHEEKRRWDKDGDDDDVKN